MRALFFFTAILAMPACYATHSRGGDPAPADAATSDALTPGADANAPDGGPIAPSRLCGCPGDPAAEVCRLPEMCCPATRTCEDPSRFRCTGSAPRCD